MDGMVTRASLPYTREYLTPGICSIIKPAAIWNKWCHISPKSTPSCYTMILITLQWHHNECSGVSNHQPHDCLLNRLFRRRSNETLKLRVTGRCEGNSPMNGEFYAWSASYTENDSIWLRHHEIDVLHNISNFTSQYKIWSTFLKLSRLKSPANSLFVQPLFKST